MKPGLSGLTERLRREKADVWAVHREAVARKAQGEDVILLSVGDPDFPTPAPIKNHVADALERDRTHYSPARGEPSLRQAIADLETRSTGRAFSADQFVVFPGATAALYCTLACVLDPKEELIVAEPMYLGYQPLIAALDVNSRTVPLDPRKSWALDVDALMDAVTPATRAVLVNTPGNPCGNVIPPAALTNLAKRCREKNLWLVCDEVYSLITFENPHVSLLKCTTDLDNVVVIDGLSKSHAMSGWRIGWAVAPPPLAAALASVCEAVFFGCPQFVQDGAAYALAHDEPFVLKMRDEYRARRDAVVGHINATKGLSCVTPQAGMFVMVDVTDVATDGESLARDMLDRAGVATIPGRGFGASTSGYVRLSLTHEVSVLEEACRRIRAAVEG